MVLQALLCGAVQSVPGYQLTQFVLDPFLRQAKFFQRVVVSTFEGLFAFVRLRKFSLETRTHLPSKMPVERLQRRLRVALQVAVIDTVIAPRVDLLAKGKQMLKPAHREAGICSC